MIISIVNNKGGVGKTTTAINLGEALAGLGHKSLLVDLDSQCSASMALGASTDGTGTTTAGVMLADVPLADIIQPTLVEGFDLAPASIELQNVEIQRAQQHPLERAEVLRRALDPIRRRYAFILVDCGPSINLLLLNALLAADEILIPVQPEYMALDGLRNLLSTIQALESQLKRRFKVAGILPTRVDRRTAIAAQVIDTLRTKLPGRVLETEIPSNVRLAEAPGARKPVGMYSPTSAGAQAYGLLAEEIIRRTKTQMHKNIK